MHLKIICPLAIIILSGCVDREPYPTPSITSPEEKEIFYPTQLVEVRWEVPDSTQTTELQVVASLESSLLTAGNLPFEDGTGGPSSFYTNQSSYRSTVDPNLTTAMYNGIRARYIGPDGASDWSSPRYYTTAPLSTLAMKTIGMTFTFDFVASEFDDYYSEVIVSHETLNLNQMLEDNGMDLRAIEFIRLDSGFIRDTGGYSKHLERIDIGFEDYKDESRPFNGIGSARGIVYDPSIEFGFAGSYRDIFKELSGKLLPMKAVYFIDHFQDHEEPVGKSHHIKVFLRLKCYSKK